ncbi:VanZ family protein [Microbacterium invictum]|uniref:VanZ family protein n=1 Tax=Microbacterium invictum TaxID=515415 RepID=A0AA40SPP2_9MICO|nr:VanZ family protein [Microbacterium invictum]MBB4140120.1 VanZ family protein [Microbacterium invictum]
MPAPSTSGPRHALVWMLALGYGGFLAFVVFWPSPIDQPVAGLIDRVIAELHERGVPGFVDYAFIEFTANIALFIPVGLLFGLALPMTWWAAMFLLGPVLSGMIELIQMTVLSARYATVSDLIANSVGATIGVLLVLILRAVVAQRDDRVIERYEFERGADARVSA